MPVMERVRRPEKAREAERDRTGRAKKPEQRQQQEAGPGNQAMLRKLAAKRRNAKPAAEEPDTPEGKADQLVGAFDADPMDQSGQARAELNAMPQDERAETTARVQDKVSETRFDRLQQVVAEPGPRSPEAPPKNLTSGAQPEEPDSAKQIADAAPASAPPEAGEASDTEGKKSSEETPAENRAKDLGKDGEPQDKPALEKSDGEKTGGKVADQQKPTADAKAKSQESEKDGGKATPPKALDAKTPADPTKGQKPAVEKKVEAAKEDKAEGEAEAEKVKAEQPKKPVAATGMASEAGQDQAAQALTELPAASKGSSSAAPASPGAPARAAAAQPGPAPAAATEMGGGGGDGGGGGVLEEDTAAASPEEEAAQEKADDKMAAAEPVEDDEEKEAEPPGPDPAETDADPRGEPSSEDKELVAQGERDRQEQTRAPEGGDAAAEAEADAPPATNVQVDPSEARAGVDSLAEDVGGGEPSGGGGGGGGAISDEPQPEPPQVAALSPVGAMSAVSGLKVGQIAQSVSGIQDSVSEKMTTERSDLQANAPSMERPSGAPQTRQSPIEFPDAAGQAATSLEAEAATPDSTGVEPPEALPDPGPSPTAEVSAPPIQGGGEGGGLTAADAENVETAVDDMPTSDPALDQDAGPPPTVELTGEASPQQAADRRAALDQQIVQQTQQGAQDAAQPMGESEIYPIVPRETLTAQVGGEGGSGGGAPVPGADDETAAIVAEEKAGDSVRASAEQASTDMQAGEEDQATESEQAKADHERQVHDLEQQNAAQQSGARASASGQVQELRGQWSQGQQQTVGKAQGDADAAHLKMSGEVEDHRQQGDAAAVAEIDKGNAQAGELRTKAHGEAEQKKAEAKEQSSGGILGWIASKAKALFDGLKAAVSAVFDFFRKALKTLIDGVKKLAAAAIDLARSAIVGAIRLAGAAIMAAGDILLAAFPELRDKFHGYIEAKVKAAEDTVNKLADALKDGINKLLDLVGKALEGLLNLLEKAYKAAIDIVAGAVQGAIKAAQAAIALLTVFAAVIKDIATHPGQWLSNLGAAVVDGIKNHLWKALKAAIKNWFFSKLEQVVGVGKAIFDVLFKGGIKLAEIGKMAFEGLKAAIPAALVAILIEKLVAMIVPAAGAVMAIIEGLQAAWGTVSRILQAIDKFVGFLKAVKLGTAGAKFADVVASAAVIVIDFVANWLLKKIRGPASKIGGKIKTIAKRILEKLKKVAKKIGAALKKVIGKIKNAFKKVKEKIFGKKKKKGKAKQKDDEKKKKKKEKKIEEAMAKTKAAIDSMIAKGTSPLVMKARLFYLKVRYGWKQLSIHASDGKVEIAGQINPEFKISSRITFIEETAHPFAIKEDSVLRTSTIDRSLNGRSTQDPSKYESQVVARGVSPRGQAGPLIAPISGPQPTVDLKGQKAGELKPDNSNLDPASAPDALLFLGSRQFNAAQGLYKRNPDAMLQQNEGGQMIRSFSVEATLDGRLAQSHKKLQMTETLLAATKVLRQFPNVSPDLEVHYIIVSPLPLSSEVRETIITNLNTLKRRVKKMNLIVRWVVVPII